MNISEQDFFNGQDDIIMNCSTIPENSEIYDWLDSCTFARRIPYKYLIPITIINFFTFITGMVGNVLGK